MLAHFEQRLKIERGSKRWIGEIYSYGLVVRVTLGARVSRGAQIFTLNTHRSYTASPSDLGVSIELGKGQTRRENVHFSHTGEPRPQHKQTSRANFLALCVLFCSSLPS